MMVVEVTALINYTCYLSEEDSIKVRKYAEEHDCELTEAVMELHTLGDIDLYKESVESDFCTQSIDSADDEDEDI